MQANKSHFKLIPWYLKEGRIYLSLLNLIWSQIHHFKRSTSPFKPMLLPMPPSLKQLSQLQSSELKNFLNPCKVKISFNKKALHSKLSMQFHSYKRTMKIPLLNQRHFNPFVSTLATKSGSQREASYASTSNVSTFKTSSIWTKKQQAPGNAQFAIREQWKSSETFYLKMS